MIDTQKAKEILKSLSTLKCDFSSLETGDISDLHTEEFKKIRKRNLELRKQKIIKNNVAKSVKG